MSGRNKPTPILHLFGDIDIPMSRRVYKIFNMLEQEGMKEVLIVLNSLGGSIDNAFAIYDRLIMSPVISTVLATGDVCSAALIILQGGTKRLSTPNCQFMAHPIRGSTFKGTREEILAEVNDAVSTTNQMFDTFAQHSLVSYDEWHKRCYNTHYYFTSSDAVSMGIVDGIMKKGVALPRYTARQTKRRKK